MVSRFRGRQSQTTTSHEHHTPGETPNHRPSHPGWATSCNRSGTPGEGLRRRESCLLDVADLRPNPRMPAWGTFGAVHVRYAKSSRGSAPQRRIVLAVPEFDWVIDGLRQWVEQARPLFSPGPRRRAVVHRAPGAGVDEDDGQAVRVLAWAGRSAKNLPCTACGTPKSPT